MSGMARGAVSLHGKHPFQCGRRNAQPPGNRNIVFYILVHNAAADDQGMGAPQHIPAHIDPSLMFLGNAVIQKQWQVQEWADRGKARLISKAAVVGRQLHINIRLAAPCGSQVC